MPQAKACGIVADQIKLVSGMNCIVGAGIAASAAVHAGVGVDLEMLIALGDCTGGASVNASAAADAGIIDCVCHSRLPPYKLVTPIIIRKIKNGSAIEKKMNKN